MKSALFFLLFISTLVIADTPPPGTVKAKTFSGDGNTAIAATGSSLNVNVTNSGGLSTVDQGHAGIESWLVDVTTSALPTNACQETGGHLASIDTKLTAPLAVSGTFWQATQPVSAASLPLPSGAATSAKQDTGIADLAAIVTNTANSGTPVVSGTVTANQGTPGIGAWPVLAAQASSWSVTANAGTGTFTVDGSGHTQPVSGTFWQTTQPVSGTFWQTTQPISAASLPLPSGAATAAKQPALGTAGTPSSDVMTVQGVTSMTALKVDGSAVTQPVSVASLPLPSGAATSALQSTINTTLGSPFQAGGSIGNSSFGISGTLPAYAATPTFNLGTLNGAATAANQSTMITSLSSLDTKTPSLGQALAAGSVPIVLTASQLSTLTPLSSVTVSGTVTANAGTGTFTVDGSGHTQPVSGTFWQATQPISGTITANIGTTNGLALDASVTGLQVSQGSTTSGEKGGLTLGAVTTSAPSYTTAQSSPFSLTTAGALRIDGSTVTQPVSGTFWQATQPVSLSTIPALAAGSAIIGNVRIDQTTPGTTNGVQVNAALPAGSNVIGHVIVDTAPTTAVTQSGTWTVNSKPTTPTALTVKQASITVGTSAIRLTNDGSVPPSTRVLLVAQLLSTSTANCYFGSSGVTTTSTTRGVQMFAGQTLSFSLDAGDYYAICDASSQTVFITEQE